MTNLTQVIGKQASPSDGVDFILNNKKSSEAKIIVACLYRRY